MTTVTDATGSDSTGPDAKPAEAKPSADQTTHAQPAAAGASPPTVIPAEPDTGYIPEPDTGYTPDGVPTLEGVRDKIEARYGTALGATELAGETPENRTAAQRYEKTQKAAAEKLDEIRASMHEKD